MKFYLFLILLGLPMITKGQNKSTTNLVSTTQANTGDEIHLKAETPDKKTTEFDLCDPDPCGPYSQKRQVNGVCVCSCLPGIIGSPPNCLGECLARSDCSPALDCVNFKCVDTCLGSCGSNAVCKVVHHNAICSCPEGFTEDPDPFRGCKQICVRDDDCTESDFACINRICMNPCDCGKGADCFISNHRHVCQCPEGTVGNPQIECKPVGCQSDTECQDKEACIDGKCTNPCLLEDPCGVNAECYLEHHILNCRCVPRYEGDPIVGCIPIGCRADTECPLTRACQNQECINPCETKNPCAQNADCLVSQHLVQCRCHIGYTGDPFQSCVLLPSLECMEDRDCPSKSSCYLKNCINPCFEFSPCKSPSICRVINTLPIRTMVCECPDGYVTNEKAGCSSLSPIVSGCVRDDECGDKTACRDGECTPVYSKVIVALGSNSEDEYMADVEIIDLLSSETTCQKPKNFPYGNKWASGGLGFHNKPLICGGEYNGSACHLYEDGIWKSSDSLKQGRSQFAMTKSPFQIGTTKLFLVGGFDDSGSSFSSSEVLTENGWQVSVPFPVTIAPDCMITVNSTSVIVIGGWQSNYDYVASSGRSFFFNSETNIWTEAPTLNNKRTFHSCGSIRKNSQTEDKILIAVGGYYESISVEVLDLDSNAWKIGPDLPFAISHAAMVEDPSGGVVLIGGRTDEIEALDTLYRLPHAGSDATWELMSQKLKTKRRGHTAFLIPDDIATCE